MARGWESKSVESQIEGANENRPKVKLQLTPEQQQAARERERLQLSRAYVKQQIARATNPAHLQALQQALKDIEEKLVNPGSS